MAEASCSRFTAAEGGARLAAAAAERNTLAVEYAPFIATRLIYEKAYKIRGNLSDGKQRSVYVTLPTRVPAIAYDLTILTDLRVGQAQEYLQVTDWTAEMDCKEVLVCTSAVFKQLLAEAVLSMEHINVLVIDSCHRIYVDEDLKYIMTDYKKYDESKRPRILAFTYPLFTISKKELEEDERKMKSETPKISPEMPEDQPNITDSETENDSGTETFDKDEEKEIEEKKEEKRTKETKAEVKEESYGVYENLDDFDMYEKLEWKMDDLEKELCCHIDLAEDMDGGKRLSTTLTKPKELIIEHGPPSEDDMCEDYLELDRFMRDTANGCMEFMLDHRFDPTEIYGEELYEEFKSIPNPTIEPKNMLRQFLYVLDQLGPYAADKAAFTILSQLEKLKIKVPYERHFLLLCLCTTIFIKIRCYADLVFNRHESDWDKIRLFSTPKVLRLAEILEKFHPKDSDNTDISEKDSTPNPTTNNSSENIASVGSNSDTVHNKCAKLLNAIEKCDFASLGDKIEDKLNTYKANLQDLDEMSENKMDCAHYAADLCKNSAIVNGDSATNVNQTDSVINQCDSVNESDSAKPESIKSTNESKNIHIPQESVVNAADSAKMTDISVDSDNKELKGYQGRRQGSRVRARGRVPRGSGRSQQQRGEGLCGIIFMGDAALPKILFMVIADMSRCRQPLSSICAQYCATEEPGDTKKQEDVLKKFRMHECNLLLATSSLEEGIDLPRCNLILRWDVPASYRSYGLCRGRGRATRSVAALLCSDAQQTTDMLLHNVATYKELDQITTRKCGCGIQNEPPMSEEEHADTFTNIIKPYTPIERSDTESNLLETTSQNLDSVLSAADSREKTNSNCAKTSDVKKEYNATNSGEVGVSETDSCFNQKDSVPKLNNDGSPIKNSVISSEVGDNVNNKCDSSENKKDSDILASVDLGNAIALINRYCGKLPSDTFTRLAPQWRSERVRLPAGDAHVCTLRLPLNCPVNYNIVGHPMPTRVLARRMVALQACRILHKSGELDDQLMPIGKENFKAAELETMNFELEGGDCARPGTTKRRQYYYKRTATAFTDCEPVINATDEEIEASENTGRPLAQGETPAENTNVLYAIVSTLWCALPERYNTRGRRLHAPQNARHAAGVLMLRRERDELQIPAFPVYTRSGEVRVSVRRADRADVRLSPRRALLVHRFMQFVFSDVLRVRRRGMRLQSDACVENNYYIVPTVKVTSQDGSSYVDVDWPFLELIYRHTEEARVETERAVLWRQDEGETEEPEKKKPDKKDGVVRKLDNPLLKPGEVFQFHAEKYREAVVTPWYRNQDQPQFFLVAEICEQLSPQSGFPSALHGTFEQYYSAKYGVTLTQPNQPLLDVDHTSARLNLLTPRYVNRKGVALPVSSERTRVAKRDRLDQKQILVPELCRVHPFAAPLWFATVALPCVLYRINALLIADEVRRAVAVDVGLGVAHLDAVPDFRWPPLDFGWSLAEVLNTDEKAETATQDDDAKTENKEIKEKEKEKPVKVSEEEETENKEEPKEKTLNDILQEKVEAESVFEIGTWSNDMASSLPEQEEIDEHMESLPSNLTFCTSASGGTNWCDPVEKPKKQFQPSKAFSMADSDCSYMSSDFDTDSDLDSADDEDTDISGFCSSKNSNAAMGIRIEYKTAHEAEAVDVERKRKTCPAPTTDPVVDEEDRKFAARLLRVGEAPIEYIEKFHTAVSQHKQEFIDKRQLIKNDEPIAEILPEPQTSERQPKSELDLKKLKEIFPYTIEKLEFKNGQITIESIEKNKRVLLKQLKESMADEEIKKMYCFYMKDVDIDAPDYVNEKIANIGFDSKEKYVEQVLNYKGKEFQPYYLDVKGQNGKEFDFDYQPDLEGHPGPSPSVILQALTMSNANDGINLERLETIGDSFLKFAITAHLYCARPAVHEGKLSHLRSKQVSNLNLYRLGRNKRLGARMIASKFEPHDNWLPPCHVPPPALYRQGDSQDPPLNTPAEGAGCFIPYNLITQHSIPDKSIADCVEALIGAYLLQCGPRGALLFMSWLGIRVLPQHELILPDYQPPQKDRTARPARRRSSCSELEDEVPPAPRPPGCRAPRRDERGRWVQVVYGQLKAPPSPLLRYIADPEGELEQMLSGYDALERTLQYRFRDRALLLQAMTHASHQRNTLTDCYQRLEFLGDAILDYLITRHLYEDPRRHSPGALTDLRSALVNNTIFATLAARHGFHKYFRHMSPGLNEVLTRYVKIQEENGHSISEEHYLIHEDEMDQAEDVEVPKALGDLFESVAGAIFLDSGMSLGAVWRSYVALMGAELEAFSAAAPKSPVRELLEAEPDTAKFGKPERLADGRRVRVCVEVFGRGSFRGVGRNYRIAKGTAARAALRHLARGAPAGGT